MYSSLRVLSRSIRLTFWEFTGWWTVTMTDLSINRTEERTTYITGRIFNTNMPPLPTHPFEKPAMKQIYIPFLFCIFSSTSETWFVGTVVGHQYGWLRNSTEDSKNKR